MDSNSNIFINERQLFALFYMHIAMTRSPRNRAFFSKYLMHPSELDSIQTHTHTYSFTHTPFRSRFTQIHRRSIQSCSTSELEQAKIVRLRVPRDHGDVRDLHKNFIALAEMEHSPKVAGVLPKGLVLSPALCDGVLDECLLAAVRVNDVVAVEIVGEGGGLRAVGAAATVITDVENLEEGDLAVDVEEAVGGNHNAAVSVADVVAEGKVCGIDPTRDGELLAWN